MKIVLVLAPHPELAQVVSAGLNPEVYRVLHRISLEDAQPLLGAGQVDVAIVDLGISAALTPTLSPAAGEASRTMGTQSGGTVQEVWLLERLRRKAPAVPIIVYVGGKPWDFEEEAYVLGVAYVLSKPVRPRMLNVLLDRIFRWGTAVGGGGMTLPRGSMALVRRFPTGVVSGTGQSLVTSAATSGPSAVQTLGVLRDFSAILSHSLSAERLLKEFLLLLREIIGVNRAAIFVRSPLAGADAGPAGAGASLPGRALRSACAIGLAPGLLEHFELSFESGIGGFLYRHGRILRRPTSVGATVTEEYDEEMEKEFELLGGEVAVPILDRAPTGAASAGALGGTGSYEGSPLLGIAVFDGRVTGEALGNAELELIFHLLEELGLAVKNIWLHDQLAENHGMLTDILRELSSACVLVSRDLTILHANKTARSLFGRAQGSRAQKGELEFSDLPLVLGSKVYQVLKTGTGLATFRYQPPDAVASGVATLPASQVFQVTILPFHKPTPSGGAAGVPSSVLLVVEDQTQTEHLKRLEIEAANLRMVRTMADRLAHEVGNALVPLSTHQQLLADKFRDAEFRASLDQAMADGVKRISRLINQMRFLAREGVPTREALPLAQLIEEAFQDAQKHQPVKSSRLKQEAAEQPIVVDGDHAALRHALSEVFLNALQANPTDPRVAVKALTDTDLAGSRWVHIDVQDNGGGFTAEALKKAPEPFFTTRNVGLGLGLAVSRKIIETHEGKLAILPGQSGQAGVVRISLPLAQGAKTLHQ